jgi:hypothetical protein
MCKAHSKNIKRIKHVIIILYYNIVMCRSRWPHGLRRRSAAARLLILWVRNLVGAWISVVSCVMSGRSFCDELITSAEESY